MGEKLVKEAFETLDIPMQYSRPNRKKEGYTCILSLETSQHLNTEKCIQGVYHKTWVRVFSPALVPQLHAWGGEQGVWAPRWGTDQHASCSGQLWSTPQGTSNLEAQIAEEQELSESYRPMLKVRSPIFSQGTPSHN